MQNVNKLFAFILLLHFFCTATGCLPHIHFHSHDHSDVHSHTDPSIRYYSPRDNFDEYLAFWGKNMPDYYIFDRVKGSQNVYILEKEFFSVSIIDSLIVSYLGENQCTFHLPYKAINIMDVYKMKLGTEEKIVLEWNNRGATGKAINNVNFTVFDMEQCSSRTVSSYNGRISCFTDLNNNGQIDYIKVTDKFYSSNFFLEEAHTDIYELSFINLSDDTQIRGSIIVIDCYSHQVTVTEDEILSMKASPCSN